MELFRHAITAARATAARFNAWTDRHRTALVRFWYLTSFAVLFAVPAHAANFDQKKSTTPKGALIP